MAQTQNIEQQIRLLSTLQSAFAIAAGVFLLVAVILFVYLKIPQVFNAYRGKNAKKEMEKMASGKTEYCRMRSADRKRQYTENLSDGRVSTIPDSSEVSEEGTMVLDGSVLQDHAEQFKVVQSIVLLHTDKVI